MPTVSLVCYMKGKYLHCAQNYKEKNIERTGIMAQFVWLLLHQIYYDKKLQSKNFHFKHQTKNHKYFTEKQPDGDVSSAIRNSLSASLNSGTHNGLNSLSADSANLQNQLVASSKLALITPVDYEEVHNFSNSVQDLKSKYIVLKPQPSPSSSASATITSNSSSGNGKTLVNGCTEKSHNGTGNSIYFFIFLKSHHFVYIYCMHKFCRVRSSLCCICFVPCSYSVSQALPFSFLSPY